MRRGPLTNTASSRHHDAGEQASARRRIVRPPAGLVRWGVVTVTLVAIIVLLRVFALDWHPVASDSMAPTVDSGDIVVVDKLPWRSDHVTRGELVTFSSPVDRKPLVKRVVAVAGDTVAIDDAVLVVNGHRVSEPYVDYGSIDGTYFGPVTVPPDHLFVLGDNRSGSVDSRVYGAIPSDAVTGRVLWILR